MRVSLDADPTLMAKQVAQLRTFLNAQQKKGGQPAVSARLQTACFLPLLAALRSELRDGVVPEQVMTAGADLIGNIAVTMVQSLMEGPLAAEAETVDQLMAEAVKTAVNSMRNQAAQAQQMPVALSVQKANGVE